MKQKETPKLTIHESHITKKLFEIIGSALIRVKMKDGTTKTGRLISKREKGKENDT